MHRTRAIYWSFLAAALLLSLSGRSSAEPAAQYGNQIRSILEKHCYDCHGPQRQKGDLNLALFPDYPSVIAAPERWLAVLERVQAFEMPPAGKPEVPFSDLQALLEWLRALPKPAQADCDQLASDRNTSFYGGYVMSRRLNRAEYNATVRDLVGLDLHLEGSLPADGGGGEGFDTSGSALFVSSIHIEKYLAAAERITQTMLPDDEGTLAPAVRIQRQQWFLTQPSTAQSVPQVAEEILSRFARRAFRRPVQAGEMEPFLKLFERGWKRRDGFVGGLRLAVKGMLVSPSLLFLAEPEPEAGGTQPLDPVPLASRLSYFIWSSMPDDELLALAENRTLLDDTVYRAQVRRMLADRKAEALGERFALQWLDLDRLGTEVRPDPGAFPEFDDALAKAMRQEVTAYFNHLIRADASLLQLIDSDFTYVNQRLAVLYGLPGIVGDDLQVVRLPDRKRGGIVGMAAVHALTSFPMRTSPVLRGHWILESLLGEKVPPPPPDVPPLDTVSNNMAPLTLRAQLERHRANAECASCHDKMDPLGFGLENFDVMGRWRNQDRGQAIDAEGVLPSGERFTGPTGLKSVLLARKDQIIRHLARKMMGFAYGRELNQFDHCAVDRMVKALQEGDYRAGVLVEQIATSFPFRHRFYPKQN